MKVFITPPINHLELSELGDNNFYILGQLFKKHEKYREYVWKAKESGRFLILDSGVGDEGEVLTNEELFEMTLQILPNEVIPLDVLYNKNQTIENALWFIDKMKQFEEMKDVKVMAVPQGKDLFEWLECYKFFLDKEEVSTIGMSKKGVPFCVYGKEMKDQSIAEARHKVMGILDDFHFLKKSLHFLGFGDPNEFDLYQVHRYKDFCRSTDSCYTVLAAMNDLYFGEDRFKRFPTPPDYFERNLTEDQIRLTKENVLYLKNCCNG